MTLKEWCDVQGRGALSAISKATKLHYPTVHAIYRGRPARERTAALISKHTKGEVSIAELCAPSATAAAKRAERRKAKQEAAAQSESQPPAA